jgi:hypothetical protein
MSSYPAEYIPGVDVVSPRVVQEPSLEHHGRVEVEVVGAAPKRLVVSHDAESRARPRANAPS